MSGTYGCYYESPTNSNISLFKLEREREREKIPLRAFHAIRYSTIFFINLLSFELFTSGDPAKSLRFLETFDDRPLPDVIQAEIHHELNTTFYNSMVDYVIDQ